MTPQDSVVEFVIQVYINTGQPQTVKEIAEGLNWSISKVKKIISDDFGCPRGLHLDRDYRPSYSSDYPMMQTGVHKVGVYRPTLETLRQVIISLKSKYEHS